MPKLIPIRCKTASKAGCGGPGLDTVPGTKLCANRKNGMSCCRIGGVTGPMRIGWLGVAMTHWLGVMVRVWPVVRLRIWMLPAPPKKMTRSGLRLYMIPSVPRMPMTAVLP